MNVRPDPGKAITIETKDAVVHGYLGLPEQARAVVVFAHGTGSGRDSLRNQYVAGVLRDAGLGTLLIDLLTAEEEAADMRDGHLRFNIAFLAQRLDAVTSWLREQQDTAHRKVGYFGASTGAAAALVAAAQQPRDIYAVVSRGGRPDLAEEHLSKVQAPTLLIVGGQDKPVLQMNQEALRKLTGEKEMVVVPGATHLFEEPGALEDVAEHAKNWFTRHLGKT